MPWSDLYLLSSLHTYLSSDIFFCRFKLEQDSPPTGNHTRCKTPQRNLSKHNISQEGGTPSWLGVSCHGVPPTWDWGTPPWKGPGTSHWGTPWKEHGTSGNIMGWRWGNPPPPPGGGQTQNIASHRTSHVDGNEIEMIYF